MTRFAHLADSHLGSWKQPELQELNLKAFKEAIRIVIDEKVDFALFAGDIFDSAYPPIEVLKEAFFEFKKLKEAKIPCFIIAGSHDYSVSGKTFLDVLEKAGFCKNVESVEERDGKLLLSPTIYKDVAIYGYPGRRSGLEIEDLKRVTFNNSPGFFNIFMLHTTITSVKGNLPIDSVNESDLPKADYYALGHVHIDYQYENFVYPGPLYPNNFQEIEDLHQGGFYIVDTNPDLGKQTLPGGAYLKRVSLESKQVESISVHISDANQGNVKVISEINRRDLKDKVVLLRIKGEIDEGKTSDIKMNEFEQLIKDKGAYCLLRNTNQLKTKSVDIDMNVEIQDVDELESNLVAQFTKENPSDFNVFISQLMGTLNLEKQEDEKSVIFETRFMGEIKKVLSF